MFTFIQLKEYLMTDNEIECQQRLDGKNINDQHLPYEEVAVPKMPKKQFFSEGNIFINKHHRYAEMPAHTHEFVEFNYMLSGSCVQYVNDKKIVLSEGELLLLDKEIVQRIDPLNEDDLLINVLLKEESITTEIVMNMVKSRGLVNEFLLNASQKGGKHDAFIHLHCGDNTEVQVLLHKMIIEYYNKQDYYMRALNLLLSLLLIELTRDLEEEYVSNRENHELIAILRYIDSHFRHLTLQELARHFGYNANYLSNKLKKETGSSFQELVNSLRYKTTIELMRETDKSFEDISYEIGFETIASLYKLVGKYTDLTPKELQKRLLKKQ